MLSDYYVLLALNARLLLIAGVVDLDVLKPLFRECSSLWRLEYLTELGTNFSIAFYWWSLLESCAGLFRMDEVCLLDYYVFVD